MKGQKKETQSSTFILKEGKGVARTISVHEGGEIGARPKEILGCGAVGGLLWLKICGCATDVLLSHVSGEASRDGSKPEVLRVRGSLFPSGPGRKRPLA